MNQKNIILSLILSCTFFSNRLFTQTWQPPILTESYQGTGGGVLITDNSLFIVQGFPAIAYYDASHRNLMYTRANDINGNSWPEPQPLVTEGNVGKSCILRVVNGNPAICYIREITGASTIYEIEYIRANDAVGSSWATPIKVFSGCNDNKLGFEVIGGFPTVSYKYFANNVSSINLILANDSDGSTWATPNNIVSTTTAGFDDFKLIEVNGNPSLCYIRASPQKIEFIRANNTTGSSWGDPVTLATSPFIFKLGSIAIINGKPAICYADPIDYSLNYIRANDANGSTWGAKNIVEISGFGLGFTSRLIQLNGLPTLFYNSESNMMLHKRATDANGDNWGSTTTIANVSIAQVSFQIELVNGNPAIVGNSTIGFIRANDAIGTTWGTVIPIKNTGRSGSNPDLKLLNGLPSISYPAVIDINNVSKSCIKFIQANSAGTAWSNPIVVTPTISDNAQYITTSLNLANGKPAICYMKYNEYGLKYTQAANAVGTTWNNIVTIDPSEIIVYSPNFNNVNGKPAVSYITNISGKFDLKFAVANDADGFTWASPQTIDVECDLYKTSLNIVNGNPAIAYSHRELNYPGQRRLKFVRASNSSGTSWNAPIPLNVGGGYYAKLMIVGGKPAVVYYYNSSIFFVIANDVNGDTWGTPQLILTDNYIQSIDFDLYGNIPIISYISTNPSTGNKILYTVKANNAQGSSWRAVLATPQVVVDASNPSGVHSMIALSSNQVGISYYSSDEQFPYFVLSDVALPVELLSFQAQNIHDAANGSTERSNKLTWQTATETNTSHFDIERSPDGKTFEKIGEVKSKGSNSVYQYVDKIGAFSTIYYRLKINDLDGKSEYSKVVNLTAKVKGFSAKVYPNPLKDQATIEISTEQKADVIIELYDMIGRQVKRLKVENTEGVLTMPLSMNDLSSVTYFLKISSNTNSIQQKIVKQ